MVLLLLSNDQNSKEMYHVSPKTYLFRRLCQLMINWNLILIRLIRFLLILNTPLHSETKDLINHNQLHLKKYLSINQLSTVLLALYQAQ